MMCFFQWALSTIKYIHLGQSNDVRVSSSGLLEFMLIVKNQIEFSLTIFIQNFFYPSLSISIILIITIILNSVLPNEQYGK